jgi:hypothetical protein
MRFLRCFVLAILAIDACCLRAESSIGFSWLGAECSNSGVSAQCSLAATVPDPVDSIPDQISASGYVRPAPNSLTFEINFTVTLGDPSCVYCYQFDNGFLQLYATGTLTDDLRLSIPAPPGSVALYNMSVSAPWFPGLPSYFPGGPGGGESLQFLELGSSFFASGTFQSDGVTLEQPVSGDVLPISAEFLQVPVDLGGELDLNGPLPPTTYSFANIQIFDPQGNPIPETFTPVPEPASFWLLLPLAGFLLRRRKAAQ